MVVKSWNIDVHKCICFKPTKKQTLMHYMQGFYFSGRKSWKTGGEQPFFSIACLTSESTHYDLDRLNGSLFFFFSFFYKKKVMVTYECL